MTNDLAQMVKNVATESAQFMMIGYEAGREAGFREGVKAEADLASRIANNSPTFSMESIMLLLADKIRGLRP